MPETPVEHEGQGFVAPDESERVNDPRKAQEMARSAKDSLDQAHQLRQLEKDERSFKESAKLLKIHQGETSEKVDHVLETNGARPFIDLYEKRAADQMDAAAWEYDAKKMDASQLNVEQSRLQEEIYITRQWLTQLEEQKQLVDNLFRKKNK